MALLCNQLGAPAHRFFTKSRHIKNQRHTPIAKNRRPGNTALLQGQSQRTLIPIAAHENVVEYQGRLVAALASQDGLALRDGELSIVYPVIALTYVWVSLLSVLVFHEPMNIFKAVGIAVIVAGVAVLGRSKTA